MQLAFCQRNMQAANADLVRICADIREELEPLELTVETASALAASRAESAPHPARRIAGALYVGCSGCGGPHLGGPSAELQVVRRALGDVPLVGFFAGGEIARHHLYGYTGVLTVFTASEQRQPGKLPMHERAQDPVSQLPKHRYVFLTRPNYTMIAMASAADALRMANRVTQRDVYEWTLATLGGKPAVASNGLAMAT